MPRAISATTFLSSEILNNPYPLYRQLRREAPVWRVPETDIFVVTSYSLLEEAANRTTDFSSNMRSLVYRSATGAPACLSMGDNKMQVLATADPPQHGEHRKILAPLFTPKKLSALETDIRAVAENCIDTAVRNGGAEFMSEVANIVPISIIDRMLGFKGADLNYLLQAAFDSTSVVSGVLSEAELVETGGRAFAIFGWVSEQLERATPTGNSVLSILKALVDAGTLDLQYAVGMVHLLLSAGGESTTSLIGNAVRILADDPVLQQQLRTQPDQIATFLEEVLRFESPFRSHLRSTPRNTTLSGITIPAGALVLMFWAAGNRDPDVFENPDQFDIDRPRKHMTFGRGIHMCLGAPLARLEAKIVLQVLLERTDNFTLNADNQPEWVESLQVRRYAKLPVRLSAQL